MKKPYEKATVKITLFDNSDVVTTSPPDKENGKDKDKDKGPHKDESCQTSNFGWDNGNGCGDTDNSGDCTGQGWQE